MCTTRQGVRGSGKVQRSCSVLIDDDGLRFGAGRSSSTSDSICTNYRKPYLPQFPKPEWKSASDSYTKAVKRPEIFVISRDHAKCGKKRNPAYDPNRKQILDSLTHCHVLPLFVGCLVSETTVGTMTELRSDARGSDDSVFP